jgi:hypothetical protein
MSSVGAEASYLIDVSVTHPGCASYVKAASLRCLSAAKLRANIKCSKYDPMAHAQHSKFVPFVFESYGAIEDRTVRFLKLLAKEAAAYTRKSKGAFFARAIATLSVGLQLGNACLILFSKCSLRSGGRAPRPDAA